MDMFSRTCKRQYYENAAKIAKDIGKNIPKANTWELLDKSFSFSRVRNYPFVTEQMDMVEHFQDNFNMNRSNQAAVDNFIRVCSTVNKRLSDKLTAGEFDNPANHDPRQEEWDKTG